MTPDSPSNILLTGASRGLGLVLARALLDAGHRVLAVNRSSSPELDALVTQANGRLTFLPFDLENSDALKEQLLDRHLPLDLPLHGYLNNAAMAYDDLVTNLDLDPLRRMYAVNVFSPMVLTKYVIRNQLYHRIPGSIVHISSISVHTGYKGLAMYASTKGALEAFSKNTAREWGERRIRSNCIVAGFMETSMSASLTGDQKDRIYKRTALKSATQPESVAAMALLLLGNGGASVTGQTLFVDSGTI